MIGPLNRPWSLEEDERLRELIASGTNPNRIGIKLKMTTVAVRQRIAELEIACFRKERRKIVSARKSVLS